MELSERIEMDSQRMNGKPVIKGTRITVELILKKMAEGADFSDLLDAYPHLKKKISRLSLITLPVPTPTKNCFVPPAPECNFSPMKAVTKAVTYLIVRALRGEEHEALIGGRRLKVPPTNTHISNFIEMHTP